MDAKRILFIIARGDAFGGSSRHVHDLSVRLGQDGHLPKVLIGGGPDDEVPSRLRESNLDFTCIPSMGRQINPWRDTRSLFAIRRATWQFRPDLISTHASKGGFLGRVACVGHSAPKIYTPHCWSFVDGFPNAGFYRNVERVMARITDRIVAVSEDERQFGLSSGVGSEEKLVRIHNGLGELPEHAPRRMHEADRPVQLAMIARFEDQKDQPLLLRALSELRDLPWELKLVGDGPHQEKCIQLSRTYGISDRVRFIGYSSRAESELADQDIFLLVTNWEGFPRSILEAMRAGLPVIASDVGGCRESVIDGENGRIVPRGDADALRDSLRDLISEPETRRRMGERGFQNYRESFSFEPMYRRYLSLYASLLHASTDDVETPARPSTPPPAGRPHEVPPGRLEPGTTLQKSIERS